MADYSITLRDKAATYPQRHGYQLRGTTPISIVVHSTNNSRRTTLEGEATFLFESKDVSAHYLVGKAGEIVQFLDPLRWQAWHAGSALANFVNARSIGVELHISVGETPTQQQYAALAWLMRRLITQFSIPERLIDTHRAIARPAGRKRDPEGWSDADFYAWRAVLFALPPPLRAVKAGAHGAIAQQDYTASARPSAYFRPGTIIEITEGWLKNGYYHVLSGVGFIPVGHVEAL